jgi:branched-chain amino acid transport system substrate-binding protein
MRKFQALLTEIAALKPDAVACFAGGGAAGSSATTMLLLGLKADSARLAWLPTEGVPEAAGLRQTARQ